MTEDQQKIISESVGVEIMSNKFDGSELIQQLHPSFCIGYASTTLCECLNAGVIPICTHQELKEHAIVYPFNKRALSWFKDKKLILSALDNQNKYNEIIQSLKGPLN